jgi:predicted permease
MATINIQFLLSISIIFVGYIFKRVKILSEKDGGSIAKLVINITLPALILKTVSNIDLDLTLALLPFLCILYGVCVVFLTSLIFKKKKGEEKGFLLFTSIGFNIGLFAYPLVQGIFGNDGLIYIAMFDVGNAFLIFGLSYSIAYIFKGQEQIERREQIEKSENPTEGKTRQFSYKTIIKKAFTNIPLVCYILAIILNVTIGGISGFAYDVLSVIANSNQALVLFVLGLFLNFQMDKENIKGVIGVLAIRYGIGLLIGIILFFAVQSDITFRTILLIAFVLPIGMSVLPYVVQFNYSEKYIKLTGTITNLTILISFGLMWFLISLASI